MHRLIVKLALITVILFSCGGGDNGDDSSNENNSSNNNNTGENNQTLSDPNENNNSINLDSNTDDSDTPIEEPEPLIDDFNDVVLSEDPLITNIDTSEIIDAESLYSGKDGLAILEAPENFVFDTDFELIVDIDIASRTTERAYFSLCKDFTRTDDFIKVDYDSCMIRTPLVEGRYYDQIEISYEVTELVLAVWFYDENKDPEIYIQPTINPDGDALIKFR